MASLTKDFYRRVSASFSATRQAPWPGWERVADAVLPDPPQPLDVLDLACGNMRFARFLASREVDATCWAVDDCEELVAAGVCHGAAMGDVRFQRLDVIQALLDGLDLSEAIDAPSCDLSVCFGFMHHVPLPSQRESVLRALVDHTRPGGHVVASFWQFARDPRQLAKATPVAGGDAGDYLLGWQGGRDVLRYCHSFPEDEVDRMAGSLGRRAREAARFSADGRSGSMNRYLVLEVQ